jgi:hypothetical protein
MISSTVSASLAVNMAKIATIVVKTLVNIFIGPPGAPPHIENSAPMQEA